MLNYLLGILTGFVYMALACWLAPRFDFTIRSHDTPALVTKDPKPNVRVDLQKLLVNGTLRTADEVRKS